MAERTAKLGTWRWYCGMHEDDDEMADCGSREDAIKHGTRETKPREAFWIVEARMTIADENAMANGRIDTAPFAESRNGEWGHVRPDAHRRRSR